MYLSIAIKSHGKQSGNQDVYQVTGWVSLPEKNKNYQSGVIDEGEIFHLHPEVPFLDGPPRRRPTWGNGRGKGASGQWTVGRLQSSKEPSASARSGQDKRTSEHIGLVQRGEVEKNKSIFTVP